MAAVTMPLLDVDKVSLRFRGVVVLEDVSFDVQRGNLSALIGPNGAGKTSFFNCVTGIYRPTSGRLIYDGRYDLGRFTPHRIARLGVARTFQNPALFGRMTVLENLLLGRYIHGRSGVLSTALFCPWAVREEIAQRERAEQVIDLLEIPRYRRVLVRDLPYGVQKRVELGRALAQDPQLLLLDEPMAGMTFEEKEDMVRFILDVREAFRTTLLLIEHDMGVVMDIADHVVVLDFGRKIAAGPPSEVQRHPAVIAAYLGRGSGS